MSDLDGNNFLKNYTLKSPEVFISRMRERTEGANMSESQSRYGIIEELNNKKIQTIKKIGQLETEKETNSQQKQEQMNNIRNQINATSATYKTNHAQWKTKRYSDARQTRLRLERELASIEEDIKTREESYEEEFQTWKNMQERAANLLERELSRFTSSKEKEIENEQSILAEIENGITNLKEMSRETTKKD